MPSMRKIILLGLAALMVAAMASATSSAATTVRVGSSTGAVYTGTVLGTSLTPSTFALSGGFGTITCARSTIHGDITQNPGVTGSITSATWTGTSASPATSHCGSNLGQGCTFAGVNLPWHVQVTHSPVAGGRDGIMTITKSGSFVGFTMACGSNVCTYGSDEWVFDLWNSTNANRPHTTSATSQARANVPLTLRATEAGLCAANATWSTGYRLETGSGANLWLGSH